MPPFSAEALAQLDNNISMQHSHPLMRTACMPLQTAKAAGVSVGTAWLIKDFTGVMMSVVWAINLDLIDQPQVSKHTITGLHEIAC